MKVKVNFIGLALLGFCVFNVASSYAMREVDVFSGESDFKKYVSHPLKSIGGLIGGLIGFASATALVRATIQTYFPGTSMLFQPFIYLSCASAASITGTIIGYIIDRSYIPEKEEWSDFRYYYDCEIDVRTGKIAFCLLGMGLAASLWAAIHAL